MTPGKHAKRTAKATRSHSEPLRAVLLALIALASAVGFVLGPAKGNETILRWSSADSSGSEVAQVPLVLTSPTPRALSATLPCTTPYVFTTGKGVRGMTLESANQAITLRVNGSEIDSTQVPKDCGQAIFHLSDGNWRILAEGVVLGSGKLQDQPAVTLLSFASPDPTSQVKVVVAPRVPGSSPSPYQLALGAISVITSAGAGILSLRSLGTSQSKRQRHRLSLNIVDLGVVAFLLGWVVLSPAFFDDGWVASQIENYSALGAFSAYYEIQAAELPFGYWYVFTQWLTVGAFEQLVFQRLLVLVILVALWGIIRSIISRVSFGSDRTGLALAGILYLVGVVAWGMTLRPEPVIALLSVAVLALMMRFQSNRSAVHLFLAALLCTLAVTAHPSGLVAFAPVLASTPSLYRWAKSSVEERPQAKLGMAAFVLVTCCVALLLFFLDTDVTRKLWSIQAFSIDTSHSLGVFDELNRYRSLDLAPYGTAARRGFVALLGVAAAAFAITTTVRKRAWTSLPAGSLFIAIGLLTFTPSKWPWHFGSLIGLFAVAFALELRMFKKAARPRLQQWIMAAGLALSATWAWRGSASYNRWDLRVLEWAPGGLAGFPVDLSTGLLWIGVAVVTTAIPFVWSTLDSKLKLSSLELLTFAIALSLVVVTFGALVTDSIVTDGWTLTKQNLGALASQDECGLGEEIWVPAGGSLAHLEPTKTEPGNALAKETDRSWNSADWDGSYANSSGGDPNWFRLPGSIRTLGLPIMTKHNTGAILVDVWTKRTDSPASLREHHFTIEAPRTDLTLYTFDLGNTNPNEVRFRVHSAKGESTPRTGLPVSLKTQPLSEASDLTVLAHPDVRQYFPCVEQPNIEHGMATTPDLVIDQWGLADVFRPLRDSVRFIPVVPANGQLAAVHASIPYMTGVENDTVDVAGQLSGSRLPGLDPLEEPKHLAAPS